MSEPTYDYIIVGAGAAGSVLANRLSEAGDYRVCVQEAGGSDSHPFIKIPAGFVKTLSGFVNANNAGVIIITVFCLIRQNIDVVRRAKSSTQGPCNQRPSAKSWDAAARPWACRWMKSPK